MQKHAKRCLCDVCLLPEKEREKSDQRRRELAQLHEASVSGQIDFQMGT